ncbi:MAG: alpha/beta hydrolase [Bacteroidia bacterium]|nr:alpha/beta hydrolase [Bacteroidia bacterium]
MKKLTILFIFSLLIAACTPGIPERIQGAATLGPNSINYELSGKGKTLVLIHGGGVDYRMWDRQIDAWENEFQILRYDIRGHGESTFEDNGPPDVEDLISLSNELGIEKFSLAGLSLGGILATDFTLAYPNKVEKLILLSPGLSGVQEQDTTYLKPLKEMVQALQEGNNEKAIESIVDMTFKGKRNERVKGFEEEQDYLRETFANYMASPNSARPIQLINPAPLNRLRDIQCPTLIIEGKQDLDYMAKNAQILHDSIPNSSLIELPNAGHMVNVEAEAEVNNAIRDFLKK